MRYLRLLIATLVLAAGPVLAGPLEDGDSAFARKDYATALKLWRPLATGGNASAQYNLGFMYANGQGVPKDDQQAVYWYRKAADQGDEFAQFNLGVRYFKGRGVPKDDQQAYFWWLLASVGGDADSVKNRDLIESRLTPLQRAAAQADARNWKPSKP